MTPTNYMNIMYLITVKLTSLTEQPYEDFDVDEWEAYSSLPMKLIRDVEEIR